MRRTRRLSPETITREAQNRALPPQREKLDQMLAMGWIVTKISSTSFEERCAISLASDKAVCWLMPDGKVERPIRGKSSVSINVREMRRVW